MSNLVHWQIIENKVVRLVYSDGSVLHVLKSDFDRAFGCIVSGSYDQIRRDFALSL